MVAYAKSLAGNKKVKLPPGFAGIDTPDPLTVVFRLQWPDAAMLANFASPWNCVYSAAKLAQDPNFPRPTSSALAPSCLSSRQGAGLARPSLVGDRVTVEVHAGCGRSQSCREGMYTSCLNGYREKGHRANGFSTDGGFAEYAVNNINTLASSRTR